MNKKKSTSFSSIRLKEAIKESGFTQKYIAYKINITPRYLSAMVTGTKPITEQMAKTLSEFLNKPAWWFLSENKPIRTPDTKYVAIRLGQLEGISGYKVLDISEKRTDVFIKSPDGQVHLVNYSEISRILDLYEQAKKNVDFTFSDLIKRTIDTSISDN